MKKYSTLLIFLFLLQTVFAQIRTNYWVLFTDKNNSTYSIQNPSEYLSERAIARRVKQNIPITSSDLPVNISYINSVKNIGTNIIFPSKWFNGILISCSDSNKIEEIKKLSFVKEVKTIAISAASSSVSKFELENTSIPLTEARAATAVQSTVLNYGISYSQVKQIGLDCLHNLGFQGQGMVIAELDGGFEKMDVLPAFDSLRMNNQFLGTHDFVLGGTVLYQGNPHGMNTLSCMVGNLPGVLIGTAPKAKYWLLRTEDAATESLQEELNWLVGAEFADSVGADIINSSLGYNIFDNTADNHKYSDLDGNTTIITKAADMAASKGIFVVSSAGNSGGPTWYKITAPADADSILTIGAIDSLGFIGSFSSRGPTFDNRIKPNTVARGVNAVVASQYGGITMQSGTSFSSPITAGAVACLWQANPSYTNMQILDAIQRSASQYATPDSIKGYGIPDFCNANMILSGINSYQKDKEGKFNLYPNPNKGAMQLDYNLQKNKKGIIKIYDLTGKLVEEYLLNPSNNKLNLNTNLNDGIYFYQIIVDDRIVNTDKLVIIK